MPLTEKITFKAILQRGNRIQIPKLIRWQYKLEPTQILKVQVTTKQMILITEQFYAKMTQDGRILIPQLILAIITPKDHNLTYHVLQITIQPA